MSEHNGKHNKNGGNGFDNSHDRDNIISFSTFDDHRNKQNKKKREQAQSDNYEPLINLPPVTKVMVLTLLGIHALIALLISPVTRFDLYTSLGFVPARFTGELPLGLLNALSPITYMLLHGGWLHVILNSFMLAALGTGTERWLGGKKLIALFLVTSLISIAVHFIFNMSSTTPVVGASGGISGLFAAVLVMMQERNAVPKGRYGLWPLVIVWVIISAMFGFMGGPQGSAIAWEAHIGGFLAGFALIKPIRRMRL